MPPKLAQKDENCGVVKKLVDLLLSQHRNQHTSLTSHFYFSLAYFMFYFYIPAHFQLGIPNGKSLFLPAFPGFELGCY